MKNKLKFVLCFISLLFVFNNNANAAIIDSKTLKDEIIKDIKDQVEDLISGKISIVINKLPYRSINIPDNSRFEIHASTNLKYFSPFTVARVKVIANDKTVKIFGVPLKIKVQDSVWVAKEYISRSQKFSLNNLVKKEKDITFVAKTAVRSSYSIEKAISRKNYKPGDVIDVRFINNAPKVVRNKPVNVIFKSDFISVKISAKALNNGKVGDLIKVRSDKYKKDYIGKVIGLNTVLVEI